MGSQSDAKPAIGLIYNQPVERGEPNWESSVDVLTQVEAIERSLNELGRVAMRIPVTMNLRNFLADIESSGIGCAFNLCESLGEDPLFIAHPAAVLELLQIPFTGSSSAVLQATTDKRLMKLALIGAGIPTPRFALYDGGEPEEMKALRFPLIIKPQHQDASIGIDQDSVISEPKGLTANLARFFNQYGPLLVEEYIDGREFNISLLGTEKPRVLPAAEIDFTEMPANLYNIVGYQAKWNQQSVEYHATRRMFPTLPDELAARLADVARRCYLLFGVRDYGRVDVRVSSSGSIFVLEVNANPCLSPDAGFPAAATAAGLNYNAIVAHLVTSVDERVR